MRKFNRFSIPAMHLAESCAAILDKKESLHLVDFDGHDIWQKEGNYVAVCWTRDGALLYTLLRVDPNILRLLIYEREGGLVAQREFADELGSSNAFISTILNSEEMVLQMMAGQGGCTVRFLRLENETIDMRELHQHACYTDIALNQKGTQFLCIENDENTVHNFSYPDLHELGCACFAAEDCNLDYTLIHLGHKAVAQYGERLFLLHTKTMQLGEELIVKGHEPVPTYQIYPEQKQDDTLSSDICYLCSAGRYLLGEARQQGKSSLIVLDKAHLA